MAWERGKKTAPVVGGPDADGIIDDLTKFIVKLQLSAAEANKQLSASNDEDEVS